jgi:hypothetical protein
MNDVKKRYRAIEHLVKHGRRNSEWQESGLLRAIERVLKEDDLDLSSKGLENLMREASST